MSFVSRLIVALVLLCTISVYGQNDNQPNVIFILSDDHRYDFMGFMGKVPELKTPAMDRLAKEGAHLQNAFVSTALCSPSRASILTGQYTHHHKVIDNQSPVPEEAMFFPEYLQKAGYQTLFLENGIWEMMTPHLKKDLIIG